MCSLEIDIWLVVGKLTLQRSEYLSPPLSQKKNLQNVLSGHFSLKKPHGGVSGGGLPSDVPQYGSLPAKYSMRCDVMQQTIVGLEYPEKIRR